MAELKTKPTTASVAKFLAAQKDPAVRADCAALIELMSAATGAPPKMWGASIVGFGDWHYVYASGREGDWFQAGFSPRKQSLTLYLLAGFEGRDALLAKLGKHKLGKGCLYIQGLADVHLPTLRTLVRRSCRDMGKLAAEHAARAEDTAAAKSRRKPKAKAAKAGARSKAAPRSRRKTAAKASSAAKPKAAARKRK